MAAISADTIITTLTIAAGLALVIERVIELLKHFMGSASGSLGSAELKELLSRAAQAVSEAKDAIEGRGTTPPRDLASFATPAQSSPPPAVSVPLAADGEASEQYPPPAIPVTPPTALSVAQTGRQLFYLLMAAGLGIVFAQFFGIRLISLLLNGAGVAAAISPLLNQLDLVFSGVVIGGGSAPVHALILFLSERKSGAEAVAAVTASGGDSSTDLGSVIASGNLQEAQVERAPLQWQALVYDGGVNPQALQATHRRPGNPNLVVYHHTAMASSQSFQAIVDEFLINKQWLTGYHCVIMPDGAIKPFCRWDRSGNHAMGHNARSLGLAFHGNFHLDPSDNYSNADGRYGNQKPTEAQLHAGARVVALWCHLYPELTLDFERHIVPHKALIPGHTVCPGSNFTDDEFQQLVRNYHQAWQSSAEAQQQIAAFKQLDYLYV